MSHLPRALLALALLGAALASADEPPPIRFETQRLSDVFFSEGATAGDLTGDGVPDVVAGPYWYEGPAFTVRRELYPPRAFDVKRYSDHFFTFIRDLDGDGWRDVLVIGFPGQDASWYQNPGEPTKERAAWTRHVIVKVVDNESPTFADLTGDGAPEIVCMQGGRFGYAAMDPADPKKPWAFHPISGPDRGARFTHGLGVGDVDGDGRADLLERTGWWQQPASLDGDPEWTHHPARFGTQGGAQMFAYDVDGDGDADVVTSLAAHGYGLSWFEHVKDDAGAIAFREHRIMGSKPEESAYGIAFSELHALDLQDLDGDGLLDIVTGKRWFAHGGGGPGGQDPAVLYAFLLRREEGAASWLPVRIDDDSGVGTQVVATDVNGDGRIDIVVGNKKGAFVHRQVAPDGAGTSSEPERSEGRPPMPSVPGREPADAAKAMTVPPGFRVDLIAGEPDLHQPVALAIDERGRVWVAEAHSYPIRRAEGKGLDKIRIFEDRDGDGTFETKKTFAEGLNLVSGLEVGFGGVFVGAAPYLLFIPDRDGDDVPDGEPEVLLDGFGSQDTHETLNAFHWGPDGWLYGCHGVFTHSLVGRPGTPRGERVPINAGIWRYHPVRRAFEVFAWGTSNPWGVDFDDRGQAFATACVIPHAFHIVQGGRYHRQAGRHFQAHTYDDIKTAADHLHYAGRIADHAWWGRDEPAQHASTDEAGGGHAHCGAMVYLGDSWPARYRNTLFMSNIHGNRINNDVPRPRGSGFALGHGPDFLLANDPWFRGINLRYGPDGSAFLIDWYDKNACHRTNPEIWDRTNGRLYRIRYGDVRTGAARDLTKASDDDLVRLQLHANDYFVRMARKVLQHRAAEERLAEGTPAKLRALLAHEDPTRRLRALWALHAIGALEPGDVKAGLGDRDPHVRGWTVQLACEDGRVSEAIARRLAGMAAGESSPVERLYIASATHRLPPAQAWPLAEALATHAEDEADPNLPLVTWYGLEPLVPQDPARALRLARAPSVQERLSRFILRRIAAEPALRGAVIATAAEDADGAFGLRALDELSKALAGEGPLEAPEWAQAYEALVGSKRSGVRRRAEALAVRFGDRRVFPSLRATLADRSAERAERERALRVLSDGRDEALPAVLHALLDDPGLRLAALEALARYDDPATPAAILARYDALTPEERELAITTLTGRAAYAHALVDAIQAGRVPRRDLPTFNVWQMRRLGDEALGAKLDRAWGRIRETSADKRAMAERLQRQLTPDALAAADRSLGRKAFKETCALCHTLFGTGRQVGPDLTGSNRANAGYVLENLADPSAVVGRDYQLVTVKMKDGRLVSGTVRAETDGAVTIGTIVGEEVLPKADIASRRVEETSMMPEGMLEQLTRDELVQLFAYLASPAQVPLPGRPLALEGDAQPGAIEGETMRIVRLTRGSARPQDMRGFSGDRWSAGRHLWWTGARPGDRLDLALPVAEAGRYELRVNLTRARDYGIVELSLDGEPLDAPLDLFVPSGVLGTGLFPLGRHDLTAGEHTLGIRIVGAHPDAVKGYMFALDCVVLRKLD